MNSFYPTVCTDSIGMVLRFNLGQEKFKFGLEDYFAKEVNKIFVEINKIDISKNSLHDLVSTFLYLNGHHSALVSLESSRNLDRSPAIKLLKRTQSSNSSSITPQSQLSLLSSISENTSQEDRRAFMPEKGGSFLSALKKLFKQTSKKGAIDDTIEEKSPQGMSPSLQLSEESAFLERSSIKREIVSSNFVEAENIFSSMFPGLYKTHLGIQALFACLKFLNIFKNSSNSALIFAKENFRKDLLSEKIQYQDADKKTHQFELKVNLRNLGAHVAVRDPEHKGVSVRSLV